MQSVVVIVQLILHYASWAGILLSVVALVGNRGGAFELFAAGVGFALVNYLVGAAISTAPGRMRTRRNS